jgi:hypothetical protein
LDALHAATGLPWWAVIPLQALAIKTMLLPVSLKQAKIVRTNMVLWTESFELQQQLAHAEQRQQNTAVQQPSAASADAGNGSKSRQWRQQQQQQQQHDADQSPNQQHYQQQQQQLLQVATDALQNLQQWQQRLTTYHDLRRKCGVPHPAWLAVNQALQVLKVPHMLAAQLTPPQGTRATASSAAGQQSC